MGQYYVALALDENDKPTHVLHSWDYNYGMKLMEHSYLDSRFVAAVETLLLQEAPVRIVWAGDYADPEPDAAPGETYDNLYSRTGDLDPYRPDVPGLGERTNYYPGVGDGRHVLEIDPDITANAWPVRLPRQDVFPYLLNWDKKLYVDKREVPVVGGDGIHPLPLLTAEGNGRGGGDFNPEYYVGDASVIGTWARDHLSLSSSVPEGFTQLVFDLARPEPKKQQKRATKKKAS